MHFDFLHLLKNWFSRIRANDATLASLATPTSEKCTVQYIRISKDVADQLRVLRNYPEDARKSARSQLFKAIKRDTNIPADRRIKINIENEQAEMFMVVCDKDTGYPWCYNDANYKQPFLSALDASTIAAGKIKATDPALASGVSSHEEAERVIAAAKATAERSAAASPALAAPYGTKRYVAIDATLVRRMIATAARLVPDTDSVPLPNPNVWLEGATKVVPLAEGLYLHDGKFYIERPAS